MHVVVRTYRAQDVFVGLAGLLLTALKRSGGRTGFCRGFHGFYCILGVEEDGCLVAKVYGLVLERFVQGLFLGSIYFLWDDYRGFSEGIWVHHIYFLDYQDFFEPKVSFFLGIAQDVKDVVFVVLLIY